VHDHVLLRQGLRRLLEDESDITMVGEADNAAECLRKVHELRPDVVVADARTFDLPAPEAEHRVMRESPRTKLVLLSTSDRSAGDFGGLRETTGDRTVLQTSAEELVEMVRHSCSGNRNDGDVFWGHSRRSTETRFPRERALTGREREVLKLLAEGRTVRATAAVLGLSIKTVDAHKFNLMRKLGIHNKAELVMWAIQRRVVKIPVNF
jgi:DNA-binding NarL/FixJ family response regulator